MVPKLLSTFHVENIQDYTASDVVQLAKWIGLPNAVISNKNKAFKNRKTSITNYFLHWNTSTKPKKRRNTGNILYYLYMDDHDAVKKVLQDVEVSNMLKQCFIVYAPSPTMKQLVAGVK